MNGNRKYAPSMKRGDELQAWFETLVKEYSESVFRFSYRSLGDWHDAEDHVHDVFEQAWKNLATLKDRKAAKSWLFAICRHRLANRFRKKSDVAKTNDLELDQLPGKSSAESSSDQTDLIQFASSKLDPGMLEVVLLVEMEQFTVEEAAVILKLPRGTVLSRLHRGKEKFRQILKREAAERRETH